MRMQAAYLYRRKAQVETKATSMKRGPSESCTLVAKVQIILLMPPLSNEAK